MTDPAGSDRIQQDVPTASGTGDNSDSGGSDLSTAQRAQPDQVQEAP